MPSDYIDKLAAETDAKITKDDWKQIAEIRYHLEEKPASLKDLRAALEERPALQAVLAWKTGYTPSKWLLESELDEVKKRRDTLKIGAPVEPNGDGYSRAAKSGLMGICFSGGGIRSATFNLGILQGLAELKLLNCLDYLSSVSGGGYIHQWLAAWGSREGFDKVSQKLVPLPEPGSPQNHPEPIRWLRRYSNYLTPQRGVLTTDTWVVIATWLRNTLLNQIILISGLLFLVLLPHVLTFRSITVKPGPGAAVVIGAMLYLFLMAVFFLAKSLFRFGTHPVDLGLFGQKGIRLGIVTPLLVSSLLFTLLFPVASSSRFVLNLAICFFVSMLLLFVLALTIVFGGETLLCYLASHHRTAHYKTFRQFWQQKPRCSAHLKIVFVIIGLFLAALFVSLCGAAWVVLTDWWIAKLWAHSGDDWWRLALLIHPPLVLIGVLLTMILLLGMLGRTFQDGRREWLARLGAWTGLYAFCWVVAVGCSLFGYAAITWLTAKISAGIPVLIAWVATSIGGLLAGKSTRTEGTKADKAGSSWHPVEVLAVVAPYFFVAGLLLLLSALAEFILRGVHGHGWFAILLTFLTPLFICVLLAWRVDINEFSMHAFYRNRLARCYLGASNAARDPDPFSGFDERDAEVAVSDLRPQKGYHGPFPIFCTTLNLTFGEDLAWQERKAASFAFTPLYSGYDVNWTAAKGPTRNLRFNGYADTSTYAYPEPGIHVSTAAAISGAALSPNWGYHTNAATAFLLTVFNVRLGWWLRNPRTIDENGRRLHIGEDQIGPKHEGGLFRRVYPSPSPDMSLLYLINELLGQANDTRQFVYLSDGGHFDNMGLYELVRRRCRYIVICDAEDDGELQFQGIGTAIRKCRIDFGAEIALDLRPLQHIGDTQYSTAHCVVGTITYPEDHRNQHATPGVVVYIKSSLTGDESADIVNYKKDHPAFPHDTTLNQWFSESQFESYRRLGHHVAFSTFEPARPKINDCSTLQGRKQYFWTLRGIWCGRTPEMDRYSADHSNRYEALLRRIREDAQLPGFFERLSAPGDGKWEASRTPEQIAHARAVASDLIEFIFVVFLELNLVFPEKRNHPFSRGWYAVFKNWTKIDAVQKGWEIYCHGYSSSFRAFAQDQLGLADCPQKSA